MSDSRRTLSVVKPGFHMSGKSRRSGILLFPDCHRFCQLMKTRNSRYSRSSGMNRGKSVESGAYKFSQHRFLRWGQRSFPTNENSNLYRRGRWRWISLITNPLNRFKFRFLAHFPFSTKFIIGKIWVRPLVNV